MTGELKALVERLRDVSEWKAIIEKHRRKTDDPSITYVLQDGTRIHEDDSSIAKLSASLSRALESASDVATQAADAIEALQLIDAMGGEDGWLPIETAPRDGTRIVAYPVTMNEAGVVSWEPPSRTPPMMRIVSGENHDQGGFWRVLLSMKPSPYPPTHWRPLPAPPALKDSK